MPWISRLLAHGYCMPTYGHLSCTLHVEMHNEIRLIDGIDVLTKRCQKARKVGWTTRDPKPWLAVMGAQAGQRVFVKERLSITRDATQHAVVERTLQHIRVACVAIKLQHTVVPEDEANRRARFCIGGLVGQ